MSDIQRSGQRAHDQLRPVEILRHYTRHAEGSVLVKFGDTHVLCTASVEEKVPPFLRGKNQGWVTAEYGMLPRSTGSRMEREAARGAIGQAHTDAVLDALQAHRHCRRRQVEQPGRVAQGVADLVVGRGGEGVAHAGAVDGDLRDAFGLVVKDLGVFPGHLPVNGCHDAATP